MFGVVFSEPFLRRSFATLTMEKAEELGKEGTEELAAKWRGLLQNGNVNAQASWEGEAG